MKRPQPRVLAIIAGMVLTGIIGIGSSAAHVYFSAHEHARESGWGSSSFTSNVSEDQYGIDACGAARALARTAAWNVRAQYKEDCEESGGIWARGGNLDQLWYRDEVGSSQFDEKTNVPTTATVAGDAPYPTSDCKIELISGGTQWRASILSKVYGHCIDPTITLSSSGSEVRGWEAAACLAAVEEAKASMESRAATTCFGNPYSGRSPHVHSIRFDDPLNYGYDVWHDGENLPNTYNDSPYEADTVCSCWPVYNGMFQITGYMCDTNAFVGPATGAEIYCTES